jgi:predicted transcriptional regulator
LRNINHILQAIKDYKGFKTNAGLAEFLGVSRSALSNWIARGKLDENLILEKIPEIRREFLRSGEYPMTEQNDIVATLERRIAVLERMVEMLNRELK